MVSMVTVYVVGTVAMVIINGLGLWLLDVENDEEIAEIPQETSQEEAEV